MRFWRSSSLFILAVGLVVAPTAWAQQKPLTQEQVQSLVRTGLGDETGAKAVERRGIDFAVADDFLRLLKAAGASEVFLNALRAARPPESASGKNLLHQVQILALLAGEVPSHRVAILVEERGINFDPQDDFLKEVRLGGGDDELINALKNARVTKPVTVDPLAQARQAEVQQHAARGAEFFQKRVYADAETEYRAAIRLDPQNADFHVALSRALNSQKKSGEAMAEAREALRLNSESDMAHYSLGNALRVKGDEDAAIAEFREALRLNPKNELVHNALGIALKQKGDLDGALAEYREALRLNPSDDMVHNNLAVALKQKGDVDGGIGEYREALRLNPNNALAHTNLGIALRQKGDLDGAIAEYREGLQINPNSGPAHNGLGLALEKKGDLEGALEQFRAATTLEPNNAGFKKNYDRLLPQVNK